MRIIAPRVVPLGHAQGKNSLTACSEHLGPHCPCVLHSSVWWHACVCECVRTCVSKLLHVWLYWLTTNSHLCLALSRRQHFIPVPILGGTHIHLAQFLVATCASAGAQNVVISCSRNLLLAAWPFWGGGTNAKVRGLDWELQPQNCALRKGRLRHAPGVSSAQKMSDSCSATPLAPPLHHHYLPPDLNTPNPPSSPHLAKPQSHHQSTSSLGPISTLVPTGKGMCRTRMQPVLLRLFGPRDGPGAVLDTAWDQWATALNAELPPPRPCDPTSLAIKRAGGWIAVQQVHQWTLGTRQGHALHAQQPAAAYLLHRHVSGVLPIIPLPWPTHVVHLQSTTGGSLISSPSPTTYLVPRPQLRRAAYGRVQLRDKAPQCPRLRVPSA